MDAKNVSEIIMNDDSEFSDFSDSNDEEYDDLDLCDSSDSDSAQIQFRYQCNHQLNSRAHRS